MVDLNNIEDYIARAVVLKNELEKEKELKEKFAKLTLLFPTLEDKMICKAIFDIKFTSETKSRKFISQMVDGVNSMVPQKITEMIDTYNQVAVLVAKSMQKENKIVSDAGGERFSGQEKQGDALNDEKHGRMTDQFAVVNAQDQIDESKSDQVEIISKKGKKVISTLAKKEVVTAQRENEILQQIENQKQRDLERQREEERKRIAYEKSLAERRMKKEYSKVASELQRIYNKHDD